MSPDEFALLIRQFADDLKADNDRAQCVAEAQAQIESTQAEYDRFLACDDWPDDEDQSPRAKQRRRILHYRATIRLAKMLEAMADMRRAKL